MYYFIINPNSRCGNALRIWKKIEPMLLEENLSYETFFTEYPGHARILTEQLTEDKEAKNIVVLGGDGTLNEVLNGISFSTPTTIGYIPSGSGNDFARSLRYPKDPKLTMKQILNPSYYRYLDYGVVTYDSEDLKHRRFAVSSGIGYDAGVCADVANSTAKRMLNLLHLGKLVYLISGIRELFHLHPVNGELVLDGIKKIHLHNIAFISAHVHRFEGGGFKFAPKADPADGQLDICVVHHSGALRLIPVLLCGFLGKHASLKGVQIYRCKEAELHVEEPLPVHTDGESLGFQKKLLFSCVPKQIRIISKK